MQTIRSVPKSNKTVKNNECCNYRKSFCRELQCSERHLHWPRLGNKSIPNKSARFGNQNLPKKSASNVHIFSRMKKKSSGKYKLTKSSNKQNFIQSSGCHVTSDLNKKNTKFTSDLNKKNTKFHLHKKNISNNVRDRKKKNCMNIKQNGFEKEKTLSCNSTSPKCDQEPNTNEVIINERINKVNDFEISADCVAATVKNYSYEGNQSLEKTEQDQMNMNEHEKSDDAILSLVQKGMENVLSMAFPPAPLNSPIRTPTYFSENVTWSPNHENGNRNDCLETLNERQSEMQIFSRISPRFEIGDEKLKATPRLLSSCPERTEFYTEFKTSAKYLKCNESSAIHEVGNRIPIWQGIIQMFDVAHFTAVGYGMSGKYCHYIDKLPTNITVIGRVDPCHVCNYITKTVKSGNKEVIVMKFLPSSTKDSASIEALHAHLVERNR